MKLLGWMHRKLRPSEALKDFAIGSWNSSNCLSEKPSLDEQQYDMKANYGTKTLGKSQRYNHLRKSFAIEEDDFEEESSAAISQLFHGFLTIGTLGSDTVIADPSSTPTFAISVENITKKETEVTEPDLKLINDELEKVLGVEGKEDGCNDSSGRNSHISTITLSGKTLEGTETSGNRTTMCPLQGYLLGSAIELPKTKKEHRTSLGELFQRTKMTQENSVAKCESGEKKADKETNKSAIRLVKKILKKRMVHDSSRTSTTVTGGNVVSASMETKLHKEHELTQILHMFHKKVYPENSTSAWKSDKPHKNEPKNNITYEEGYYDGDYTHPGEDIIIFPHTALSKESIRCFKRHSNPSQLTISGSNSNGNSKNWINTDADCKLRAGAIEGRSALKVRL
ncbi:unnamed protein product [Camellia sinensis]